jgi:hypothetical protein
MKYARPPFPPALYARFTALASKLGYSTRGHKWKLLDMLLSYAETHSDLFRRR